MFAKRWLTAFVAVFSMTIIATHTAAQNDTSGEGQADVDSMVITILEAGDAPRKQLRYRFKEGESILVDTSMKMTMTMEMLGQRTPPNEVPEVVTVTRIKVDKLLDKGDARMSFEVVNVRVNATTPQQRAMAPMLEQQMRGMIGVKGEMTMNNRGAVRDTSLHLPENINPQMAAQMQSIEQSMSQIAVPLPAEAVGRNGKWQVDADMEVNAIRLQQQSVYQVQSLENDLLKALVQVTQKAGRQQIAAPGTGEQVTLAALNTTGKGQFTAHLNSIRIDSTLDMETRTVIEHEGQQMTTIMNMKMSNTAADDTGE